MIKAKTLFCLSRVFAITFLVGLWPLGTAILLGQSDYGNSWINPSKDYYKFFVDKEGIYHIKIGDLKKAGMPTDQIKGLQIQLFSLGQEIPIRVSSENSLTDSDFIEFYGEANSGETDSFLYSNSEKDQLNPRFSLYSTKRPYYVSWSDAKSNKRYKNIPNGLNTNNLPPLEEYYIHHETRIFGSFHFKPTHNGRDFIRYSNLDSGEGFGSELKTESEVVLPLSQRSPFGPNPKLIIRFGTNSYSRQLQIFVDDIPVKTVAQGGYGVLELEVKLDPEKLASDKVKIKIKALGESNEKHSLAFVELQYPRKYDFQGGSQFLFYEQGSIISRRIEIKNYGGRKPVLYNLDELNFLHPEFFIGTAKFISPASLKTNRWIISDESDILPIKVFEKRSFSSLELASDYLIISHPSLNNSGAIDDYANYRSSSEGGGYKVKIKYINDITDEFGYGIEGHPLGLINYFKYLESSNKLPKFIFLIGKGREYQELRVNNVTNNLVPTFGSPGSDNMLLSFTNSYPNVAIGRLAAQSSLNVTDYLNKIRLQESPSNQTDPRIEEKWKKTIIHLSGGSSDIQLLLFNYLNEMAKVISFNKFSADVVTFRKISSDPLQKSLSEEILKNINLGASMVTFFGHSAVGTFDLSLENPAIYKNQGKNPVILSLGCYSGNIFTATPGISEEFVLQKNTGAIAFLASSGTAYISPQYELGMSIYNNWGGDMYGMAIGEVVKKTIESKTSNDHIANRTLLQQITLHGDPAYKLNSFRGPDYYIDPETVNISPQIINTTINRIEVKFDIINLGSSVAEPLDIEIIHLLPNGTEATREYASVSSQSYRTNVIFELVNPGSLAIGKNKLLVRLNHNKKSIEYPDPFAYNNNKIIDHNGEEGHDFLIVGSSAKPVSPQNFSIWNQNEIVLKASINNPFLPLGKFLLQIDTSELFNSPILEQSFLTSNSSIIEWKPTIRKMTGVVYYWRISALSEEANTKASFWQTSSFIYDPTSETGWNQSHYFQWLKDEFYTIKLDSTRRFQFDKRVWDVRIKNELRDAQDYWVFVNNTPWASLNPKNLAPGLAIFIWQPNNQLFENKGRDFGSLAYSKDGFIYKMDKIADRKNIKLLLDAVPKGSKVFIHTILADEDSNIYTAQWASDKNILGYDLYEVLEAHGARKVRGLQLRGTVPYIFIFEKGVGAVIEDIANNIHETIDLSSKVTGVWEDGILNSVRIGPVDRWMRLVWEEQTESSDSSSIAIYGIRRNGKKEWIRSVEKNYNVNLTNIDPVQFPYLELSYMGKDKTNKTIPQLKKWQVLYKALPDVSFYTTTQSLQLPDTIAAGEDLIMPYKIANLSSSRMEEILVKYTLTSETNKKTFYSMRTVGLESFGTADVRHVIFTDGLTGKYEVEVELNAGQEQGESEYCNNFAYFSFYVIPDDRNPILDVTFDNRHIKNGALVRQNPLIKITLSDFGSKLLLNNSSDFDIKLYYPQLLVWKPRVGMPSVEFIAAQNIFENVAQFVLRPNLNMSGIYTLEVQAKDIAGNFAGSQAYRISFKVGDSFDSEEPFRIYPNPISDYAKIEYFLNSEILPEVFSLNIYSSSGVLVKSVKKEDFGGILSGLNHYRWNGTDQSGKKLPHGIYFYELVTNIDTKASKKKGSLLLLN